MSSESEKPVQPQKTKEQRDIAVPRIRSPLDGSSVRGKGYKGGGPAETMPPPPANVPSVSLAPPSPPEPTSGNAPSSNNSGSQSTPG